MLGKPEFVDSSVHPVIKSKVADGWANVDLMKKGYTPIDSERMTGKVEI